jgi:glycosyltransferase involved in cell wall biosynthesis
MQAVRVLAPAMPELRVLIIGPLSGSFDTADEQTGSYARQLVEKSRDLPVRFLGFINNREQRFRQHLAAADVSIVPSLIEPQGLVVLEALAMGVPVIGAVTGGIADMVTPDAGYLFTSGDAMSLAKCISQAHEDRSRLQRMSSVARARVRQHFSWSSVGDRYLDAFARQANA